MDKKYQIFISSTYTDLIEERKKVRDVILSMYQFPIGMEMFSAADEEQWEIIKETIDSSDYYVLIIGKRYGSVINDGPDKGISYTEKEYRYAKSIGLPILAYIKEDSAITVNQLDKDLELLKKLQAFKDDVTTGREVKWFSTIDQLGTEVTLSLHKAMDRKNRPGWIRGDSIDIEKSLSEIVELSAKNRELQEKNAQLLAELEQLKSVPKRKPELTLTVQMTPADEDTPHPEYYQREDLITIDDDGTIHLKLKKISVAERAKIYEPRTRADIPDGYESVISDEDIKKFNDGLPSKAQIEEYLGLYQAYLRLKENGIPLTFFVNNIGTAKATDISVSIEFPDKVRIINTEQIIDLPEPESPEMPEDIIKAARRKTFSHNSSILDMITVPNLGLFSSSGDFSDIMTAPFKNGNTIYSSITIQDNIVEIENKKGIVHTKFDYYYGGYIVPLEAGEYEAKVQLMCAEYVDPEEYSIKIIVEE